MQASKEKSSHLTTFHIIWQVSYTRLLFGVVPVKDMFQRKTEEIFKQLKNVSCIVDDSLITGYNNTVADHDRKENLKNLDCDKYHFRYTSVPFLVRLYQGIV